MKGIISILRLKKFRTAFAVATIIAALYFIIPLLLAQQAKETDKWESWRFLLGEWTGETSPGQPGQGSGSFTFSLDLDNNILVRKGMTRFPATKDRPAIAHDDLMIVYQQSQQPAQAIYFDNEDHVIKYATEFSSSKDTLTFLSEIIPNAPRFRLSYIKIGPDTLKNIFEMTPPGKPEAFKPYLEGLVHRK
jgi:hypothetical protein